MSFWSAFLVYSHLQETSPSLISYISSICQLQFYSVVQIVNSIIFVYNGVHSVHNTWNLCKHPRSCDAIVTSEISKSQSYFWSSSFCECFLHTLLVLFGCNMISKKLPTCTQKTSSQNTLSQKHISNQKFQESCNNLCKWPFLLGRDWNGSVSMGRGDVFSRSGNFAILAFGSCSRSSADSAAFLSDKYHQLKRQMLLLTECPLKKPSTLWIRSFLPLEQKEEFLAETQLCLQLKLVQLAQDSFSQCLFHAFLQLCERSRRGQELRSQILLCACIQLKNSLVKPWN